MHKIARCMSLWFWIYLKLEFLYYLMKFEDHQMFIIHWEGAITDKEEQIMQKFYLFHFWWSLKSEPGLNLYFIKHSLSLRDYWVNYLQNSSVKKAT